MDRRNFLKSIVAAAAGAAFSSRIGRAEKDWLGQVKEYEENVLSKRDQ